jgi:hypothetical protein
MNRTLAILVVAERLQRKRLQEGLLFGEQAEDSKPANEVITGFLPEVRLPEQGGKRPCGASEAYRELIELELSRGRNAMGIWQDLVDQHG